MVSRFKIEIGYGSLILHAALESLAVSSGVVNDLTNKYAGRMCLGRWLKPN